MKQIRSMTGYARARRPIAQGEVVVALKSVNHRGLDLHFHLGVELEPIESALRAELKKHIARGHVDIRASAVDGSRPAFGLNRELLRAWLEGFREAAGTYGLAANPDLNAALRLPGMFETAPEREMDDQTSVAVFSALGEAIDSLNAFRAREGSELADLIRGHNQEITRSTTEMEEARSGASAAFRKRLDDRMNELLRTAAADPQRLAQEAALLLERSDIAEELGRLRIHSRQLNEILDAGGETGKKLDFLLQEMQRETNTILSKSGGAGDAGMKVTDLALAIKAAIEKMREQALNLE